MANINKNIIMQAGAAVANATNKAAGLSASTPEPGTIISAIQLVNGGRTIGPDALAHFTESVRNKLLSLLVSMEPIQSGSGTPSPDNVRPISGRTGLAVYVSPTPDPDDATTYSVDWTDEAGTVYGGTLDVVTGLLTVDRASAVIDESETFYKTVTSSNRLQVQVELMKVGSTAVSDRFSYSQGSSNAGTFYASTSNSRVFFNSPSQTIFTTLEEWNTWLAENPIQVVYELATPLTYQLTTQDIITLVGDNNIWSDSGDVTITE